jgi:hypothetical protein
MKDKLTEILSTLYKNKNHHDEWDKAEEEIKALMCYWEVRAICKAYGANNAFVLPDEIMDILGDRYPEQTILQAIEQVKGEINETPT